MPNSPVVINGNGYSFEGFVVAERFLKLKTATDFPEKAIGGENYKKDDRGNEYYLDDNGYVYYHKKAEGGTRYIQVVNEGNGKRYRDVIYAKGSFTPATKNPDTQNVSSEDNIYMCIDDSDSSRKIKYVEINPKDSNILYRYNLITQEKFNVISYTNNKDGNKNLPTTKKITSKSIQCTLIKWAMFSTCR